MSGDSQQTTSDTESAAANVATSTAFANERLPATQPVVIAASVESAATPTPVPPHRRGRRIAVAAGFILVAISTAVVLIAVALTQESPRWWKVVNTSDPETIATAERVENGVASALTQVRAANNVPLAPNADATAAWKVFITTEQANAWLNVRLKRWLADQAEQGNLDFRWPEGVGEMQVSFQNGLIHLGAKITRPASASAAPHTQTLAAALRPEFKDDGSLWMTAERIEIGRLPVPASWVLRSVSGTQKKVADVSSELARQPQTERVLSAFRGQRPVLSRPSVKLSDGRRVRIIAIEPAADKLVITCTTEQREATRR